MSSSNTEVTPSASVPATSAGGRVFSKAESELNYAAQYTALLVANVLRRPVESQQKRDEEAAAQVNTRIEARAVNIDPSAGRYTVQKEADLDGKLLDTTNALLRAEQDAAAKFGLKPLSAEAMDEMISLRSRIANDAEHARAADVERYKTLSLRGVSDSVFDEYAASVQQASRSLMQPGAEQVHWAVSKDVFEIMAGDARYRFGGWADAEAYPAAMRQGWIDHGMLGRLPRFGKPATSLTAVDLLGEKAGHDLNAFVARGTKWYNDMQSRRMPSKFLVGIYGFMAAWILWYKWIMINEREINRQKVRYALRMLDDEGPMTHAQVNYMDTHMKWAANYFDEEDEDEDEAADEDDDAEKDE